MQVRVVRIDKKLSRFLGHSSRWERSLKSNVITLAVPGIVGFSDKERQKRLTDTESGGEGESRRGRKRWGEEMEGEEEGTMSEERKKKSP